MTPEWRALAVGVHAVRMQCVCFSGGPPHRSCDGALRLPPSKPNRDHREPVPADPCFVLWDDAAAIRRSHRPTLISELLDGTAAYATKSSEAGFGSCRLPPASLALLTITSVEHVTSLVPLPPSRRATPVSAQHCAAPISQDSGGRGPTIGPMRCAGQRAAKLLQALISIPSVLCLAALAGTARMHPYGRHAPSTARRAP